MINPKHIPVILSIVQEGSITAASKKLYVSQPALSQTVRMAEEELGAPIFIRGKRSVELTRVGEWYVHTAREIQKLDRNLRARVADVKQEQYGEFTLGISTQRGLQLLPKVIPEFIRLHPHVRLRLREEGSGRLEKLVADGQCDIAFITTMLKHNQMHYVLIENEHLVLMAARDTDLARRFPDGATISIAEARDERFISMSEGHSVRLIQDRLFEKYGMQPRLLLETNNMEAAKGITARAGAVFLLPNVYVRDDMPDRSLVNVYQIDNNEYERHFYFCYRQGMYLTRYEKDLVRIVCAQLGVTCSLPLDEG